MSQLRKQLAYDRLLARLFSDPEGGWILKGGVAMLARLSVARHSADVDLVARADSPQAGLEVLREHAAADLGDFFTFVIGRPRRLVQGVEGVRVAVEARLGPRMFERFGVDLVTGVFITGIPETAAPLVPMAVPGVVQPDYLLYPLVDTVADKVAAMSERKQDRPSTRFRDLVDIVLVARNCPLQARDLRAAFASERLRRALPEVVALDVPDEKLWRAGYASVARDADVPKDLDEALGIAKALVDPVLDGRVRAGRWEPAAMTWGDGPVRLC
nr:nucleotidyl transferase AbiEii/AbiGii toxin family protein [Planomonospora venezuelensis]